jgi:hypothetical protein
MNSKKYIDKLFDNTNVEYIFDEILQYMNINPNYTQEKLLKINSFQEILMHVTASYKDLCDENDKLKIQIEEYKEYVDLLETHIKYMPNGDGYFEAKKDYETYIKEN